MKITTFALFFIILVKYSYQKSTPKSDSYVAAVVEFSPEDPTSPEDPPIQKNADRYVSFIEEAAKQKADIIVFPEAGLTSVNEPARNRLDTWTTIVPAPSTNYIPCIHTTIPVSKTLIKMSCAAKDNMIYVVINLSEKVICINESCPSDQRLYYNTNVVFDREGKIIARYRKTNLFIEPGFNVTKIPEVVTFETDFGVTFGTFTCFDILFKKPAMYLTRMLNITDIVFPTAWFSEVPFLTALQSQAGWSYAEDANFLVSGYDRPKSGNSGSGIYLGRQGIATAIISETTTSEMLIAKVPKKNLSSSYNRARPRYDYNMEEANQPIDEEEHYVHDELRRKRSSPMETAKFHEARRIKRNGQRLVVGTRRVRNAVVDENNLSLFHEDLSSYKSHRFDSSITRNICDGDFCCDFDIRLGKIDETSKYRMMVYDGTRRFAEPVTVGLRICAIVHCANESLASCGNLAESETFFDALTINATFPNYEDILVMTNSIGPDLVPLANWSYAESWDDKRIRVTANLSGGTRNIVTCGIYGRDFSRDSWDHSPSGKNVVQWATLSALAIVSLFLLFLYRKGWRKPWHSDNPLSSDAGPYQNLQTR